MPRDRQAMRTRAGWWAGELLGALMLCLIAVHTGAAAPPGQATLVGPSDILGGASQTFTWKSVSEGTRYYLKVSDATNVTLDLEYTAEQAKCANGETLCFIALTATLAAGQGAWWVRAWNSDGLGPLSNGMIFRVYFSPPTWSQTLAAADRFQIIMQYAAVLDRETGLVWERVPSAETRTWLNARSNCINKNVGFRKGWRLPSIHEMESLVDTSIKTPGPLLPAGHPFVNVKSAIYWSASTYADMPTLAWGVPFDSPGGGPDSKANAHYVWCVRGAGPLDNY